MAEPSEGHGATGGVAEIGTQAAFTEAQAHPSGACCCETEIGGQRQAQRTQTPPARQALTGGLGIGSDGFLGGDAFNQAVLEVN